MTDKNLAREFVTALAKDDYVTVNKLFPDLVDSSVKTIINNKKADVIDEINAKANSSVKASVLEKEPTPENKE